MKKYLLSPGLIACFLFLLNSEYAAGQTLSIADSVVHTYCGEATGSITINVISGQSPYSYSWSTGATTSSVINLASGTYEVTVYDDSGDSLLNEYVVAYHAAWDTLVKFATDNAGGIIAVNPLEGNLDCYASAVNSLSVGQDGWVEFVVDSGDYFDGVILISDNLNFDETTQDLLAFYIHDGTVDLIGTGIDGNLGSFDNSSENRFRIELQDDTVRFLRFGGSGLEFLGELSYYHPRNYNLTPTAVGFNDGSRLSALFTSFGCGYMKTRIQILPAENFGEAGNVFVTVKGGSAPYNYTWSRGDNSADLLVASVGEYALTVTDQDDNNISRNVFIGSYTDWDFLTNISETPSHSLIVSGTPDFNSDFPALAIGKNELQPDSSGIISFDFSSDSTFVGIVGLITNFVHENSESDSLQLVWIAILPDSVSEEIPQGGVYILHDVEGSAGTVDYVGKWKQGLPLNIKIYAKDDSISVVKNDIRSLTYAFPRVVTMSPFVAPFAENSTVQSVTLNFGKAIRLNSSITNFSCDNNTHGSITVSPDGGLAPYQYIWSNGASTSLIDNLNIGDYSVTVSDSSGITATKNYKIGFAVSWDTLSNLNLLEDSALEFTGSDSVTIGRGLAVNTFYPNEGENGWLDFNIGGSQWTDFNSAVGLVGFVQELPFQASDTFHQNNFKTQADTTHQITNLFEGTMIWTFGRYLGVLSSDSNIGAQFLGSRGLGGIDDIIHFEFYHGDSLRIRVNETIVLESKCNYPDSIKPAVVMGSVDGTPWITGKIKQVTASFCNEKPLRVEAEITPAENVGTAGSIDVTVSGGRPPFDFEWSTGATTEDLVNVSVGEYQLTITEQGGHAVTKNIFLGGYVDWDLMSKMEETDSHELIVTSDSAGSGGAFGYSIGSNELDSDSSGIISFDFLPDSIFGGVIGITNFFDMQGESNDVQAIAIGIVPDSSNSDRMLFVLHGLDSTEANPIYIGTWESGSPLNIKLNVKGDSVTVMKDDIRSFSYEYLRHLTLNPVVIPNIENSMVHRVTCNFGERLKLNVDVTNIPCGSSGNGSISVTVDGGVPPYQYLWSSSESGSANGDTTSSITNLDAGEYVLTVLDSIGNAVVRMVKVGHTVGWDTLYNIAVQPDGSLEPAVLDSTHLFGIGLGANTLYTGIGETGWMEFKIASGDIFMGIAGFITPFKFPLHKSGEFGFHTDTIRNVFAARRDSAYSKAYEFLTRDSVVLILNNDTVSHSGTPFDSINAAGIVVFKNIYMVVSTDTLLSGEFWDGGGIWGILDTARDNVFRIERNHVDSIRIVLNNKVIANSRYTYPVSFKPAVAFLPFFDWDSTYQDLGKIKYFAASFCNDPPPQNICFGVYPDTSASTERLMSCANQSSDYQNYYSRQNSWVPNDNIPIKYINVAFTVRQRSNPANPSNFEQNNTAHIQFFEDVERIMNDFLMEVEQPSDPRTAVCGNNCWIQDSRLRIRRVALNFTQDDATFGLTNSRLNAVDPTHVINVFFTGDWVNGVSCIAGGSADGRSMIWMANQLCSNSPAHSVAFNVLHEIFHDVGINHVYQDQCCGPNGVHSCISGQPCTCWFGPEISNTNSPDYLIDVFGNSGTHVWESYLHDGCDLNSSCSATSDNNDNCTNNFMGWRGAYISPLQMGRIHRNLMLNATQRLFACGFEDTPFEISTDQIWDFDIKFYQNIIVKSGATLTIRCILRMVPSSKIIVEPGAKLIVDGGTITNAESSGCIGFWDGIIVEGDPTQSQFPISGTGTGISATYNQGAVFLIDATIENAKRAIDLSSLNPAKRGGFIQANNSSFINNLYDVVMYPYRNFRPGHQGQSAYFRSDQSFFNDCKFTTNNSWIDNSKSPQSHVFLWGVSGVRFLGCVFDNERTGLSYDYQLGNGIVTLDAGFSADYLCLSSNPTGCTSPVQCEFNNLRHGIWVNKWLSPPSCAVNHSLFNGCIRGIRNEGVNLCSFIGNKISVGNTAYLTDIFNNQDYQLLNEGIILHQCSGFTIEGNEIYSAISGGSRISSSTFGIRADGTGSSFNNIRNNKFINLYSANLANRQNRQNPAIGDLNGLQYTCNTQEQNTFDNFVASPYTNDPNRAATGIQLNQGNQQTAAGNSFSGTGPYQGYQTDFVNYSGNGIEYHHFPSAHNFPPVLILNVNTGSNNQSQNEANCSNAGSIGAIDFMRHLGGITDSDLKVRYGINHAHYLTEKSFYNSLLDDGDANALTAFMQDHNSPEYTDTLKSRFLGISPYVSENILKKAATMESALSNAEIFEIFSANPDAINSDELIDILLKRNVPMPDSLIDSIISYKAILTERTYLEDSLQRHFSESSEAAYEMASRIMLNEDSFNIDLLRQWLDSIGEPWAAAQSALSYFDIGKPDSALSRFHSVYAQFALSKEDSTHLNNLDTLLSGYILWLSGHDSINPFNLAQLDSATLAQLDTFASGKNEHLIGTQCARNAINAFYNGNYFTLPQLPEIELGKRDFGEDAETQYAARPVVPSDQPQEHPIIKVYPNPAKDYIIFEASIWESDIELEIYDLYGRKAVEKEIGSGLIAKVETVRWSPGLYVWQATRDGSNIGKGKFSIIRW